MNLIPWRSGNMERRSGNPMQSLQQEIDRLFEQFVQSPMLRAEEGWPAPAMATYPRVDMRETDAGVQVTAELPGMSEQDIDITVADDVLTLRGEKKGESERSGPGWHWAERSYGKFERVIGLPPGLADDKAQASFKNGVLTISLPRKEGVKRNVRKIKVSAEH